MLSKEKDVFPTKNTFLCTISFFFFIISPNFFVGHAYKQKNVIPMFLLHLYIKKMVVLDLNFKINIIKKGTSVLYIIGIYANKMLVYIPLERYKSFLGPYKGKKNVKMFEYHSF